MATATSVVDRWTYWNKRKLVGQKAMPSVSYQITRWNACATLGGICR